MSPSMVRLLSISRSESPEPRAWRVEVDGHAGVERDGVAVDRIADLPVAMCQRRYPTLLVTVIIARSCV